MMKQNFSAGGVLVNNQNQVYLIYKKTRDEWALPKGGIEKGETELEAAEREIKEETGYQSIKALVQKPIKTSTWTFTREGNDEKEQKTTYYFLFRLRSKDRMKTPEMNAEGLAGDWFSFEEAIEKTSLDNVKEVLEMAKRGCRIKNG
ncbi:NUDIX domain-containing protein [Patescibacteria group bacterium]|nr:NUDIX domain-containing protein [Patescibacteria group bacterium]